MSDSIRHQAESAQIPDKTGNLLAGYITAAELAALRGVGLRALDAERRERRGPPFVKFGRLVLYRLAAVEAWLLEREQAPPLRRRRA